MRKRKMEEKVTTVGMSSTAADIVCFMNTWAKELHRLRKTGTASPSAETRKLWDFLTALRGPDVVGIDLKSRTTERIRVPLKDLCYQLATVRRRYTSEPFYQDSYRDSLGDFPSGDPISRARIFHHDHFMDHILRANMAIREMFPQESE